MKKIIYICALFLVTPLQAMITELVKPAPEKGGAASAAFSRGSASARHDYENLSADLAEIEEIKKNMVNLSQHYHRLTTLRAKFEKGTLVPLAETDFQQAERTSDHFENSYNFLKFAAIHRSSLIGELEIGSSGTDIRLEHAPGAHSGEVRNYRAIIIVRKGESHDLFREKLRQVFGFSPAEMTDLIRNWFRKDENIPFVFSDYFCILAVGRLGPFDEFQTWLTPPFDFPADETCKVSEHCMTNDKNSYVVVGRGESLDELKEELKKDIRSYADFLSKDLERTAISAAGKLLYYCHKYPGLNHNGNPLYQACTDGIALFDFEKRSQTSDVLESKKEWSRILDR